MRFKRCYSCGEKDSIRLQNAKGKYFPYKQYELVKLRVDLFLLTCYNCDEMVLCYGDAEKLDKAIEESLEIEKGGKQ